MPHKLTCLSLVLWMVPLWSGCVLICCVCFFVKQLAAFNWQVAVLRVCVFTKVKRHSLGEIPVNGLLSLQYFCQKLSKSVEYVEAVASVHFVFLVGGDTVYFLLIFCTGQAHNWIQLTECKDAEMQPIVADVLWYVSLCVCLTVCLSVCVCLSACLFVRHDHELCWNSWSNKNVIWDVE